MTHKPHGNTRLRIATIGALSAALPINTMRDMGYDWIGIEIISIAVLFASAGILVGWILHRSLLYFCAMAFIAYAFIDIHFLSLDNRHVLYPLALLIVCTVVFCRWQEKVLPYALVFAIVFSGSSLFRSTPETLAVAGNAAPSPTAPGHSILHIVLDEMGSPFDVAYAPPPGHPAAAMLRQYEQWGFKVHSQAYADSPFTKRTMSAVMALDPAESGARKNAAGAVFSYSVPDNRYIRRLLDRGYAVSVLQSSYIDLCLGRKDVRCETYSRTGGQPGFGYTGVIERLKFALDALHGAFYSNHRSGILLYSIAHRVIHDRRPAMIFYIPLLAGDLLEDHVLETAKNIQPGEAYLVHAIFPHYPYFFDADCNRVPLADVGLPLRHSIETRREDIYPLYWDQAACAHSLIRRIVEETRDLDFLTTIIHGDHGPRVGWLTDDERPDDLRKTFVAIRHHGVKARRDDDIVPLNRVVIDSLNDAIDGMAADDP